MKPWERKLHDWGLLGYLVKDVIGAHQEESFGIRQNHRWNCATGTQLIRKHFAEHEYELFVPERGWGERVVKRARSWIDSGPTGPARLLGGTLAAMCRKAGPAPTPADDDRFETLLRCPDCHARPARRRRRDTPLRCACGYAAPNEGGVYNLLRSADKNELYPGDRDDVIDFSLPGHDRPTRRRLVRPGRRLRQQIPLDRRPARPPCARSRRARSAFASAATPASTSSRKMPDPVSWPR